VAQQHRQWHARLAGVPLAHHAITPPATTKTTENHRSLG
jgi:hypothetical protein